MIVKDKQGKKEKRSFSKPELVFMDSRQTAAGACILYGSGESAGCDLGGISAGGACIGDGFSAVAACDLAGIDH